jgi:hypothetical protein
MSEIFVPASLNGADAVLAMVAQMENLLDVNKRKAMTEDIVKFHALNEAEKKKAADARALIKQHTDILEETRRIAANTEEEKKNLISAKQQFEFDSQSERSKIAARKLEVDDILQKTAKLHDETKEMKDNIESKIIALSKRELEHAENVKKHEEEKQALAKQKSDIDQYKNQVIALDNETKAKVEKLKQFNF